MKAGESMVKTDPKIQELIDRYGDWFSDDNLLKSGSMSQELYPYDQMFSPIQVNRMTLKTVLLWLRWAISACVKRRDVQTTR